MTSQYTGASKVFTCMSASAGQTAGSVLGQELELLIWAPSIRYGLPSTISANLPLRSSNRGSCGAAGCCATEAAVKLRSARQQLATRTLADRKRGGASLALPLPLRCLHFA